MEQHYLKLVKTLQFINFIGSKINYHLIRFKSISKLALLLFFLAGFTPISFSQELSIKIAKGPFTMEIGDEFQFQASVVDENGNEVLGRDIFFYSKNRRAVSVVDSTGMAKAIKHGEYGIIVISPNEDEEGYVREEFIVVVNPAPIASVQIGEIPSEIYAGTTIPLSLTIIDKAGFERTDVEIKITSSNEKSVQIAPFHKLLATNKGKSTIVAEVEGIEGKVNVNVVDNPITRITLVSNAIEGRTGDVFYLEAKALDKNGNPVNDAPLSFSFAGESYDISAAASGMVTADGKFVADEPGLYTITVSSGPAAASITISAAPREVSRKIELVGQGTVNTKHTSDFWIWEGVDGKDYGVTGTWGADGTAYFWDVTNPAAVILIDSIKVDARVVNDVKVSEDGKICVISREGASDRKNGLIILDVSNPADVTIISTFSEKLTGGVHNVFIDNGYVYALSAGRKYYTINIKDPKNTHIVGEFELDTPGHSIHDVWIEDGIAYSSNWSDGVQLVDVGNGIAGGTPENPVQFASYAYPSGSNHAAFPYHDKKTGKFYVIAGDEEFPYGLDPDSRKPGRAAGYLHVIDFTDLENPKEVAWFQVSFAGSHNFWIEDDILYAAFYNGGVRVVDLSGELLGDLNRQGREIAWIVPEDPDGYVANAPFTWGVQPHKGHIFYSDWNSGLWAAKLEPVVPKDTKIESR